MSASRWMIATVLVAAAAPIARAQPADSQQPEPQPQPQPQLDPDPKPEPDPKPVPRAEHEREREPEPEPETKAKRPRPPDPHIDMPTLINSPTGWLLPAAVLYSRTGVDTGGGFISDQRVGLGDVAEFGVSTLDQVRSAATATDAGGHIQPYFAATFRMGVTEDRLFDHQPGTVLGFRKSFEHDDNGNKTQIAELTLVLSWHVGQRAAVHLGGAFWDASLDQNNMTVSLHDHPPFAIVDQLRPFAGVQIRPFKKSEIMVDFGWAPKFCYTCTGRDQIGLYPELSWGVRYEVADWMRLESGVRVPAIDKANLLDAQIFGAITFTTWALKHKFDDWK